MDKKKSDDLIIANKELAFQKEEKEKYIAELIIADKELVFQNKEKETLQRAKSKMMVSITNEIGQAMNLL